MNYALLKADLVLAIHNAVLNPGEWQGMAGDKSLDGALARVGKRLVYGMIEDVFGLAAAYGVAIATGHVLADANRRTAYRTLPVCLKLSGIGIAHDPIEAGDLIREVAQGLRDEDDLAAWLRKKAVD